MYPFYNFCQFFAIFTYILPLVQKLRCTKEIYDLDDSLAWKYIILGVYIANIFFEILSKSIFGIFFSTADSICMIITDIPLKKRNFWKNAPRGLNFSSNHPLHAQMILWKNQQNPLTKWKITFFLTENFWSFFCHFQEIFLNI